MEVIKPNAYFSIHKKHLNFPLYMYKGRYTHEVIYQFVS